MSRRERSSFVADLREGWVAFRSRRWVWTFVLYFAIVNLLWGAWGALGPVVADRDLGGAAAWGTVLAAMGVGALAGSLLATRVKPRRPLVFVALTDGLFALPLAFLAAAPPVPLIACGALLSGAGMALAISVWESTLQRHIPGESLSRVSSYDWFGSLAFYPLGTRSLGSGRGGHRDQRLAVAGLRARRRHDPRAAQRPRHPPSACHPGTGTAGESSRKPDLRPLDAAVSMPYTVLGQTSLPPAGVLVLPGRHRLTSPATSVTRKIWPTSISRTAKD